MEVNKITDQILKCAFEVHTQLGPGLFEKPYEECMNYELKKSGLFVEKQKPLQLVYKELKIDNVYFLDLVVENQVIVELKSVEILADIHSAQLLTYLKLSGLKIGLLLNFNVLSMKNGIKRLIN
jgi:GxxExxY protein